jgi:hypothetical protein
VLSIIAWLANKLYAIEEKGKEVANVYRHGPCLILSSLYSTTVQTRIQCNDNSTRSYKNQSVFRAVSKLVKNAINHSLSKHGLETLVKSLFYLFVRVYAVLCTVHGQ